MQFIQNNKWLYAVLFGALTLLIIYLYTFFNRKVEQKPDFPSDHEFILKDLKYGRDTLNYLDLYLPKNRNSKTPVLIIIHGGAWVGGDKNMFWTDMALDFFKKKVCVVNMNYRLVPKAKLYVMLSDIKNVCSYLNRNNKKYTLGNNYHLLGTSAGGHLALLYAYTIGEKDIASIISFAGPVNFNDPAFYAQTSAWGMPTLYKDLLGKDFVKDAPEMINASPIHKIKNKPVLLVHASNDDVVPFSHSKQLADSLQIKKIKHMLFTLPNGKHAPYGLNNSFKDAVNEAVIKWIKE